MKRLLICVTGLLLIVGGISATRIVHAEAKVYNRTENYIDMTSLPGKQTIVGTNGRITPQKNSVLSGFDYAFVYDSSDSSVLSVDAKGNWTAHKAGKVYVTVSQQSIATATPTFLEEFQRYGLSWYDSGVAEPSVPSANATVEVTVVDQQASLDIVYRLYQPLLQVHLYTKDPNERRVLASRQWRDEGIAWKALADTGQTVYRLYNENLKEHLYTTDKNEYNLLGIRGWRQESIAYYSSGSSPVYRLYHAGIKKHLFTKDEHEKNTLVQRGWTVEGIAWYVQ